MEKLKIFFKNKYIILSYNLLIMAICSPIMYYNIIFIKSTLLSKNDTLFYWAGNSQGSYYSDFTFDYILKNDSLNSKYWWESSVAYNKRGDHEIGMIRLKKATTLNSIGHLGYSGWIKLDKLKDYENALKDLKKLDSLSNITEYPWGDNIYYRIAICHQGLEAYDSARIYYTKYFNSENDKNNIIPISYTYLGKLEADTQNYKKALELFNKTIYINNNIPEAYFYKAETFEKLNLLDSANSNYNKSLILTQKLYKQSDPYNEVFLEIYPQQIESRIKYIKKPPRKGGL